MQASLRQSDAVCQSSRSQFYALLSDAELYKKENRKSIYERIEENWQAEEISKEYDMTMESFAVS